MPNPRLTIKDHSGVRTVPVDKPIFTIGRRQSADVQIHKDDQDVSKYHAEIVKEIDAYVLRDTASKFGTFVNGERIKEHRLVRGDRIRLSRPGGVELLFDSANSSDSATLSGFGMPELRMIAAIMDGLRALGSGRVLEDVLALVIDLALDVAKAERGFIMLANEAGVLEIMSARSGHQTIDDKSFGTTISAKIPREVFETDKPCVAIDLDAGGHPGTHAMGVRSVTCVPLRAGAAAHADGAPRRVIGVLYLDHHLPGRTDSQPMLQLVEALAAQAAIAIESARLYAQEAEKAQLDRDLRIAADMQRSLLADPAYLGPTCELAAVSIPCRTIGGDFYDYLETSDGRFAFALGDVAGKGPPAGLLAAALQSNFAAYAALSGNAAETVANCNTALLRRPIEARFATMFHGVLTRDGRLSYSSAGHEPPCVVGPGGVRWLEAGGPVLGLFPKAMYEADAIQLSDRDVVVICSDGVTEATDVNGKEFGRARIAEVVSECPDLKPEAILEHLVGTVRAFCQGTPQADDITVMVIRAKPRG